DARPISLANSCIGTALRPCDAETVGMTSSPHDALFKSAFADPQHAAAELRHILRAELAHAIDWNSLRLEPGSFIDPKLANRHSDLLFSANLHHRQAYIYLLFEHQSANDPWMALRLLAYMVRIWERRVAASPKAPLPPILPAVLAQVDGGWSAPTRFAELFEAAVREHAGVHDLLPDFVYLVDDLSKLSDEELAARGLADFPSLALWLLRDIRDPEALLRGLTTRAGALETLLRGPNGAEYLIRLLRYVALTASELPFDRFYAKLTELSPSTEPYAMTIAEQLRHEGRHEGQLLARRADLLAVLEARGLPIPDEVRARV